MNDMDVPYCLYIYQDIPSIFIKRSYIHFICHNLYPTYARYEFIDNIFFEEVFKQVEKMLDTTIPVGC